MNRRSSPATMNSQPGPAAACSLAVGPFAPLVRRRPTHRRTPRRTPRHATTRPRKARRSRMSADVDIDAGWTRQRGGRERPRAVDADHPHDLALEVREPPDLAHVGQALRCDLRGSVVGGRRVGLREIDAGGRREPDHKVGGSGDDDRFARLAEGERSRLVLERVAGRTVPELEHHAIRARLAAEAHVGEVREVGVADATLGVRVGAGQRARAGGALVAVVLVVDDGLVVPLRLDVGVVAAACAERERARDDDCSEGRMVLRLGAALSDSPTTSEVVDRRRASRPGNRSSRASPRVGYPDAERRDQDLGRAEGVIGGGTIRAVTRRTRERRGCSWPRSQTPTSSSSKRCAHRSGAATAACPPCTRPTCSARCRPRSIERSGIDPARGRPGRRRVREPGRRADLQHRPHRVAVRRPADRGRGHDRRRAVRLVAAGHQPRGVAGRSRASSTWRCRCGVERMSRVPLGAAVAASPGRPTPKSYFDAATRCTSQFEGAERIAEKWGDHPRRLRPLGLESQQRARSGRGPRVASSARCSRSTRRTSTRTASRPERRIAVDRDEGLRETSLEALAKLKPVGRENGVHTAGSSSQITDGAAAVLMTTAKAEGARADARGPASSTSASSAWIRC